MNFSDWCKDCFVIVTLHQNSKQSSISLLFAGKHSIEDLNATQPTADSTLQFRYRLLNSEEDEEKSTEEKQELKVEKVEKEKRIVFPSQKEIVFPKEKENDVAPLELLTQPSTVKEKFEKKKVYSYSPFPSQSDLHPVKVVNSLPKHPATKDIASAYEHNSYPKHEYTALHDYNSYPSPSQVLSMSFYPDFTQWFYPDKIRIKSR